MKLLVVDPLTAAAVHYGYNRPLDRHDFPGGHVPDRMGAFVLARGELRRFTNLNGMGNTAVSADSYSFGTTQRHPLGTLAYARDGRIFRYASAGAADLVPGNIVQGPAPVANHLANTPPAVAIGATSFVYTPGATLGAANLYAEGTLVVDTTPGNGLQYGIAGHAAFASATAFTLNLYPDDPIQVALTTSSRVGLHHNQFKTCIVNPTTNTGTTVGGAVSPITANTVAENFGWLQTRGPFPALINGTPGVGIGVVISATTAGAVDVAAVAAEINVRIIGRMMQVGVSTKNNSVYLLLD